MEFRPISNRIPEYHHFEEQFIQVCTILDGIVGSSDLSSTKETVLFLCFLFLQIDLFLEAGILDDSVWC